MLYSRCTRQSHGHLYDPLSVSCCTSVSLQWINSCTLVLVDSHEKLHVVDRPSQEVLETLDLEQVQLVYNSRHFKSLATGGNVSQALVRVSFVRHGQRLRLSFEMLIVRVFWESEIQNS